MPDKQPEAPHPDKSLEEALREMRMRAGEDSVGSLVALAFGLSANEVVRRYGSNRNVANQRKYNNKRLISAIRANPTEAVRILGAFTRENALLYGFQLSHQAKPNAAQLARCCDIATKAVDAARPANKRRTAAPVPPATPPGDVGQALGGAD